MKRKLLIAFAALALFGSGVVSAAALWGTYNGYSIIRITVNGVPTEVSDVPAINMDNRTMIPIYLLQQAGIEYTWDTATRTVDIKKPEPTPEPTPTPDPTEAPVETQVSGSSSQVVVEPTPPPYVGPTDAQVQQCITAKQMGYSTTLIPHCY